MEQPAALVTSLLNFGAMGVLSAILLYLHISSLRTVAQERQAYREDLREERATWQDRIDASRELFSKELKQERDQCHADHERTLSTLAVQHEAVMRALGRRPVSGPPPPSPRDG